MLPKGASDVEGKGTSRLRSAVSITWDWFPTQPLNVIERDTRAARDG